MDEELPEYSLSEIEIGFKKNFEITITESMLNDFAKLSGDYNPCLLYTSDAADEL